MATQHPRPGARTGGSRRTIAIDESAAGELFDALSSATAREILAALYERPRTASEVADVVDTSVQNVHHHFGQLRDADLVEVTGTRRSEQGREMDVYAPATDGLVLFAGAAPGREEGDNLEPDWAVPIGLGLLAVAAVALWRYLSD